MAWMECQYGTQPSVVKWLSMAAVGITTVTVSGCITDLRKGKKISLRLWILNIRSRWKTRKLLQLSQKNQLSLAGCRVKRQLKALPCQGAYSKIKAPFERNRTLRSGPLVSERQSWNLNFIWTPLADQSRSFFPEEATFPYIKAIQKFLSGQLHHKRLPICWRSPVSPHYLQAHKELNPSNPGRDYLFSL